MDDDGAILWEGRGHSVTTVALPSLSPTPPPQLTLEPDTAMSSSVLMATHVTSASWPYRTWTGLGAKPLEKPP